MKSRKSVILLVILLSFSLNSCKIGRLVIYNFSDISDYKKFPSRTIKKGGNQFQFYKSENATMPKSISYKEKKQEFEEFLEKNKTVAFMVIRNDSILYEKYFNHYNEKSITTSFSMSKSVISMLIGCAIEDKLIESVHDPVTKYIPEMQKNGFDKVTIEHVLQMTSGLKFTESYNNPFGHAAAFYYGRNLKKQIFKLKLKNKPGESFEYKSGNTQILGLILERALKDKTVSEYFEEKIWQPLGMEFDASWSIDQKKNGIEKTFCCINARARDFAKLGRLYLNKGNWNGKQIVSENWVSQSTKVDSSNGSAWYYQYQWWLPSKNGDFMARGYLGQYIYVHPEKNLIIVRMGKKYGKVDWYEFIPSIAQIF